MNDSLSATAPATREQSTRHAWLGRLWRGRGILVLFLDAAVILGASMLAMFWTSFWRDSVVPTGLPLTEPYFKVAVLLASLWVTMLAHAGSYGTGLRGVSAPMVRARCVIMSGLYSAIIIYVVVHALGFRVLKIEECVIAWLAASFVMLCLRLLLRVLDRAFGARGVVTQAVLVAGTDRQARDFAERLRAQVGTIRVAGYLCSNGNHEPASPDRAAEEILGDTQDIEKIHDRLHYDTLVVSMGEEGDRLGGERILEILNFCERKRIHLYMIPRTFDVAVTQDEVASLSGIPLVRLQDAFIHPGYFFIKRIMDIGLSVFGIVVGGLFVGCPIALIIRLTSRGPIIFRQTRVGLHGDHFRMYKFRTMVADAEERLCDVIDIDKLEVPGFKIENDPRVTSFGRFLRRTGLDELPQLLNVLKGEMSLVGPRPELPNLVDRYTPDMRRRLKAKPGITGYQQIVARGMPLAAAVKYDLIYMKHQSLLLDLYILLRTVGVVLFGNEIQRRRDEGPTRTV